MMPSCDQTGTPSGFVDLTHFRSSTTSGSACLISVRNRDRVACRQSSWPLVVTPARREEGCAVCDVLVSMSFDRTSPVGTSIPPPDPCCVSSAHRSVTTRTHSVVRSGLQTAAARQGGKPPSEETGRHQGRRRGPSVSLSVGPSGARRWARRAGDDRGERPHQALRREGGG